VAYRHIDYFYTKLCGWYGACSSSYNLLIV
jgi:hypothetical protein